MKFNNEAHLLGWLAGRMLSRLWRQDFADAIAGYEPQRAER